MINPLRTAEDYELFVYTIPDKFSSVKHSTLTLIRKGASLARVAGEVYFDKQVGLVVRERILFDRLPAIIDWYGYEVWKENEKLYWYDSQPHPNDEELQSTYPHHKHIRPNMKHNRIPALELSFDKPNLPFVIQEIEDFIKNENID